jgi:hypothetical protein
MAEGVTERSYDRRRISGGFGKNVEEIGRMPSSRVFFMRAIGL